MKKRIVVSSNQLPLRLPVVLTWLCFLSQSVWAMPGWLIGVMWTFTSLMWVIVIVDLFNVDSRNPFDNNSGPDQ